MSAALHFMIEEKLMNKITQRRPIKAINVIITNRIIPVMLKIKSCNF
jgi:hypothetical protein